MSTHTSRSLGLFCLLSASASVTACNTSDSDPTFRSTYGTGVTLGDDSGGPGCEPTSSFDVDTRRSLFETSEEALASFSMHEVLAALASNAGVSADPEALHDQLFDTFDAAPGVTDGAHCDDDVASGGGPGLNGYPLQCPRAERQQVGNLDAWFPIAAVNRFDLAPSDGANCGEARLVFANNAPIGPGRNFVIFEAKIPNPAPGCGIDACAPVQEFWAELSDIDSPAKRGSALRSAFLDGNEQLKKAGFGPFVTSTAFGFGAGQVRTNSFNQGPWTLREFKTLTVFQKNDIASSLTPPQSFVRFVPVPVAANPFGLLWDDTAGLPHTKACANALIDNVANLMTDDPNLMGVSVPVECLAAESPDTSVMDYGQQLNEKGPLAAGLRKQVLQLDPLSSLTAVQIANRALFSGGCIGCHQRSNIVFNRDLGNGVVAPSSLGFVHTSESRGACGDGNFDCFRISPALENSFLPHREQVMEDFLNGGPCCDPQGGFESSVDAEPIADDSIDVPALIAAEQAAEALVSTVTVAGHSTQRAH